jgi:hypothetical protein
VEGQKVQKKGDSIDKKKIAFEISLLEDNLRLKAKKDSAEGEVRKFFFKTLAARSSSEANFRF